MQLTQNSSSDYAMLPNVILRNMENDQIHFVKIMKQQLCNVGKHTFMPMQKIVESTHHIQNIEIVLIYR
jgi:hypothetical protein